MTKIIRNSALLALICAALGSSYVSAADSKMPAGSQNAAAGETTDTSKQASVAMLAEYACKKGTPRKGERTGLVSVVMERGPDSQPTRVLGVKDSKTGEVAFVHVLESDCSGGKPPAGPEAASLVLADRAQGQDEYFYAISSQAGCMRAFHLKFLGQFVPVEMSTKLQDCQKEMRSWFDLAETWKTRASSAGSAKP